MSSADVRKTGDQKDVIAYGDRRPLYHEKTFWSHREMYGNPTLIPQAGDWDPTSFSICLSEMTSQ